MMVVMGDGRVFQGSATEVVRAMQRTARAVEAFSLSAYIAWVVANARRLEDVELEVSGDSDDELASALLDEMLRYGLSRCL